MLINEREVAGQYQPSNVWYVLLCRYDGAQRAASGVQVVNPGLLLQNEDRCPVPDGQRQTRFRKTPTAVISRARPAFARES